MRSAKQVLTYVAVKQIVNYLDKDFDNNFPKILSWAHKIPMLPQHKAALEQMEAHWRDQDVGWPKLLRRAVTEIHPNIREKLMNNFLVNATLDGIPKAQEMGKKYNCHVPYTILMDPTSACNLKCIGCWAGQYDKHDSLSLETLDRIIREGKQLGIYAYIYSGGEPLVRKEDLITLARKHSDCIFLSFTNGTLIDRRLCEQLVEVGNLIFAISIEGFEAENDLRRGSGTFARVSQNMELLKEYKIPFGYSTCYHSKNTEAVASDEYVDMMIEKGAMFGWYFTYMPLGKDADVSLLVTPKQRELMYRKVREWREKKPIFVIDFWNDGEYVHGCVAGGRSYFHINSRGDVEPCAFIHYSDVNIHDVSLVEALRSPLFLEYQKRQPFNQNHLRPCPLLDNPDILPEIVRAANAHSTQAMDEESAEDQAAKCREAAEKWAEAADRLWSAR